ncbi:MAG: hypothetical protein P4L62_03975 [Candidatus Pacebacteria bacterium]|nr:hypothetical protein [Candidatus Paceibacterota bacterium]
MNFALILSQLGIPADLTQDFSLLIVVALVSLALGLAVGRTRLVAILVNTYISFALLVSVPKEYLADYTQRLIFFFVLLIILILTTKNIFEIIVVRSGYLWRVILLGFWEVMLVLTIVLAIVPKKMALDYVSLNTYPYLTLPIFHLAWLALPIVFVILIQKNLSR